MCIRYFIPREFDLPALIYYSFDAAAVSGSTLLNLGSGGAAYNAQLINSPAISTSDKMVGTGAIQFTSSLSQYVQIPSLTTGTSGLSFAFWFKFAETEDNSSIFDFGNGMNLDNILLTPSYILCTDGSIRYQHNLLLRQFQAIVHNWIHVTWTINTGGTWEIYLNGNLYMS